MLSAKLNKQFKQNLVTLPFVINLQEQQWCNDKKKTGTSIIIKLLAHENPSLIPGGEIGWSHSHNAMETFQPTLKEKITYHEI